MKPFDLTKFRKKVDGKIEGLSVGFHDPSTWLSTGNYTLNYLISNNFHRGIPLSQITMLAGESGSGKSLIAAGVIKYALENGISVVAFDSENAYTEEWLTKAGVNVKKYDADLGGNGMLMRIQVSLVDTVAQTISSFMEDYKKEYKDLDRDDRPPMLIVVDSLGMLLTRTDMDQFAKGDLKGDMGRKPKALNALVRNCVVEFAEYNVGMLATNHTYQSQDMFDPDDKISGGGGFVFASSIVIAMRKLKLKEDEEGNKVTDVRGIRAAVKVVKSRYNKPFESVQVRVPYESGIDPYSGLVDLFEKQGLLVKDGNRLKYIDLEGNEHKYFRKYFFTAEGHELLNLMMAEHDKQMNIIQASGEFESMDNVNDFDEEEGVENEPIE